jgi:hypothetical protein
LVPTATKHKIRSPLKIAGDFELQEPPQRLPMIQRMHPSEVVKPNKEFKPSQVNPLTHSLSAKPWKQTSFAVDHPKHLTIRLEIAILKQSER